MYAAAIFLASLVITAFADPKPPSFTYLYSINLTMPAGISIGNTPVGSRAILPISGGKFWGPKFNGWSSAAHFVIPYQGFVSRDLNQRTNSRHRWHRLRLGLDRRKRDL